MDIDTLVKGPILFDADNFTPLSRTPWAGRNIFASYKSELFPKPGVEVRIGESWEFSCDPDFPSKVSNYPLTLPELLKKKSEEILSEELINKNGSDQCEILVKLLNADSPLSLQVHPDDSNSALKENECGKPESWLVLDAEEGSGLYLGFSKSVSKAELRSALLSSENAEQTKKLLQFVPVKAGDYFEISPGVAHAVGSGVTLLEPQRILFGKSGKTYRFWDWGRKYDEKGILSESSGKPRELHLDAALEIIDSENQVGMKFVDTTRREPKTISNIKGVTIREFPKNPYYQVLIFNIEEESQVEISVSGGYAACFSLKGEAGMSSAETEIVKFPKGQPGLLPNSAFPVTIKARDSTELALVIPSSSEYSVR